MRSTGSELAQVHPLQSKARVQCPYLARRARSAGHGFCHNVETRERERLGSVVVALGG